MDNKSLILDIAMNLNRIGNWAADGYENKKKRILTFLKQNNSLIISLKNKKFPDKFKQTLSIFLKEYKILEKEGKNTPQNPLFWAEKMMTWGNILTHRVKYLKEKKI